MRAAVVSLGLVACVQQDRPSLPDPIAEIGAQANGFVVASDRVIISAGGQLREIGLDGSAVTPVLPAGVVLSELDGMNVSASAEGWIAWTRSSNDLSIVGRRSPTGVIEELTQPAMTTASNPIAGPDGVFYVIRPQSNSAQIVGWTIGEPESVSTNVFPLVAADVKNLYVQDSSGVGRIDRVTGSYSSAVTGASQFGFRFGVAAGRIIYTVNDSVRELPIPTGIDREVGDLVEDCTFDCGAVAGADRATFVGPFRYLDGAIDWYLDVDGTTGFGPKIVGPLVMANQVFWMTGADGLRLYSLPAE